MSSSICGIYIPRMSLFVDEDIVKRELSFIGTVKRVDFTPVNKKLGFVENVNENMKSAFVHFQFMLNSYDTYFKRGESFTHYLRDYSSEKWILLKAHNPVQDTMMNNAQIVENCRFLEKKVEEQAETIKELEKKVEGIHNVVFNLLGGLFNQTTQSLTLEEHLDHLFPNSISKCSEYKNTSEWGFWPTTRQGDNNERRIEELEKKFTDAIDTLNNHADSGAAMELKVQNLANTVSDMTNFGYDETLFQPYECEYETTLHKENDVSDDDESTHSSMPDLIEVDFDSDSMPDLLEDTDDDDSMPELESVSSSNSREERLRNSFELCGNQ